MTRNVHQDQAVEKLQQFGLREYEAKCFVALTKIQSGTARDVSEQIDIPRTRVYEAVRSLESAGLVEIQHSSPQQFRAIPIAEAVRILDEQHETRINSIEQSLREIQQSSTAGEADNSPEVWSITGQKTIATRVNRLIDDADSEVLLLVGHASVLSESLSESLSSASDRGVDVIVGAGTEALQEQFSKNCSDQMVYNAELDWLQSAGDPTMPAIGRCMLADREYLVASTIQQGEGATDERAVCGSGSHNGVVLVLRQLLAEQLQ